MRRSPRRILDALAASRLATLKAAVEFDGERLPFVEPIAEWADPSDFDSELCRAGVKRFARPTMTGDWPEFVANVAPHVLVSELSPGIRRRDPALVTMGHECN